MSKQEIYNRGFNLMVVALLVLPGLAFGSVILNEHELNDKIDDTVLLVSGIIAVVWYLMGRNRFSRSIVPVGLVVLSLAGQIVGVLIEKDDKEAIGDNIGGMIIFVGVLILVLFQYFRPQKIESEAASVSAP